MTEQNLSIKPAISSNGMLTAVSRQERVGVVNEIMKEIANRGRKFFYHQGKVAEIVDRGRIYAER